ncbi:hypothetical protein ACFVS2_21785 [Brevibacillus sp. NPDC058079]|uniref:hypothetical protein n=1 Tax=Brevibacillus sp. NPDC058079 TaxID=3346330 RepID=UPI0036E2AF8F
MLKRKKKYEDLSFEALAKVVHGYLLEEGWGLDLRGFREALKRYFRVHDNDIAETHELMIECNLWYNYFGEIQAVLDFKKEEWTLEADWLYAHEKIAEPSEQLENRIQHAKLRAKHYGMFSKHVESQKRFFWKASEHCQSLYKRGIVNYARS